MTDVFYEETSTCNNVSKERRRYYTFKTLNIVFIVLTVLWGLIIFFAYDFSAISNGIVILNIIFLTLPFLSGIGFAVIFNMLKNKHSLAYDYVFISGSIRVSKVINNVKRKNLYDFDTTHIEKIGKFGSESYCRYEKSPNIKTIILTSNNSPTEGKTFYYMAVNGIEQKKLLLIFECTNLFIVNVMKFTKSYVLEKETK